MTWYRAAGLAVLCAFCALPLRGGAQSVSLEFDATRPGAARYYHGGRCVLDFCDDQATPPVRVGGKDAPVAFAGAAVTEDLGGGVRLQRLRVGQVLVDAYWQTFPDKPMVRRWFDIEWTGDEERKIKGFRTADGFFKMRGEGCAWFFPGLYTPERHAPDTFAPGKLRESGWGQGIVCAGDGGGVALAIASDITRPYSERANSIVVERADGLVFAHELGFGGWCRKGVKERIGDLWVVFAEGGDEEALMALPSWYEACGARVPQDRDPDIRDTVLYSCHPAGCFENDFSDKGGFKAAAEYLPFVKALGCTTIWLRPVEFECYVPDDYYKLMPGIGTEQDFKDYVARAHGLGLKVWRDAVMHGGKNTNARAKEHPEWLVRDEKGDTFPCMGFDYNHPGWIEYFARFIEHDTRKYFLDGWRMDIPAGSQGPNWAKDVPYRRACFALLQGGFAQQRAIRAAARAATPWAATLAESNESVFGTVADAIYDQPIAHVIAHFFCDRDAATVVSNLRRRLHEQKWSSLPDTVFLRYPESHDCWRAEDLFGRAAANALMALCAWIDGIPLVYGEGEDGAFDAWREIFAIRAAVPELTRGDADYLGVKAPPGVFACLRSGDEGASVVLVNFNANEVAGRIEWAGGAFDRTLPAFGYEVVRVRGKSVEECRGAGDDCQKRQLSTNDKNANINERVDGSSEGFRRIIRIPGATDWFAHSAEGDFSSPVVVRHPTYERCKSRCHGEREGAVVWDSLRHPMGFVREHAEVGGVCGDRAVTVGGFAPGARVRLCDRLGDEPGLAIVITAPSAEGLVADIRETDAAEALRPRGIGTGDPRLTCVFGGWQFDDGVIRVRFRRNGAIVGVWENRGGEWEKTIDKARVYRRRNAASPVQLSWTNHDRAERSQEFESDANAIFTVRPNGGILCEFPEARMPSFGKANPEADDQFYRAALEFDGHGGMKIEAATRGKRPLPPEDLLCYKVDFANGAAPDIRLDGTIGAQCREERMTSGVRFVWQDDDALKANKFWRGVTLRIARNAAFSNGKANHVNSITTQFPDKSRVIFYGDSITRLGGGILRVAAQYRALLPERDVRFFNAGISGGGLAEAKRYFDAWIAAQRPTHVVMAFGVNDAIGMARGRLADPDEEAKRVDAALAAFRHCYAALIDRIEALGATAILRAITPFDDTARTEEGAAPADPAKAELFRRVAAEIRSLADERGLQCVDDWARMSDLLAGGEDDFMRDRIHPNDRGQWRMAETFLAAQGMPSAPYRPRGETAESAGLAEWDALSQRLANILSAEQAFVRDESLDVASRLAKARAWLDENESRPGVEPVLVLFARDYLRYKPQEAALRAALW